VFTTFSLKNAGISTIATVLVREAAGKKEKKKKK
jgi:hypothetical protein